MKKIICVLIAIMTMVSCFTIGYAEETENMIHLTDGSYTGGIDIPSGEYILHIDNRQGTKDISFEYRCEENPDQEISCIIQVGCSFEMYVTVYDTDILVTDGYVDLYINLE